MKLTGIDNELETFGVQSEDENEKMSIKMKEKWCAYSEEDKNRMKNNLIPGAFLGHKRSDEFKKNYSIRFSGKNANNSKFTEREILEIRSKFIPHKYTRRMLAEEYGTSEAYIKNIVHRKCWKLI